MNYGYKCQDWKDEHMEELGSLLTDLCFNYPDQYKMLPYVEIDFDDTMLYQGVRIRRITHLTEKEQKEIVKKADEIKLAVGRKYKYSDNS